MHQLHVKGESCIMTLHISEGRKHSKKEYQLLNSCAVLTANFAWA